MNLKPILCLSLFKQTDRGESSKATIPVLEKKEDGSVAESNAETAPSSPNINRLTARLPAAPNLTARVRLDSFRDVTELEPIQEQIERNDLSPYLKSPLDSDP